MPDFLLELRSEEIPARMQGGARADLEKLFRKEMDAAGVALGAITVWSTPRRLALIARGLPDATAAVSEEVKGPKVGAPEQALDGFLRKTGLGKDQLTEREGVWFAVSEKPGRATRDVLAEAIPAIIRAFPWPKSQRWGAASISTESLRWVRPLSGIVAIFGQELVDCEVGDIRSGFATMGHRFHHPGEITIGGAADYQDKLRACHVIVDHAEREALIREKAAAASAAGLVLVEDEGLVVENAGLTEWPVPLLGRFDEAYLEVPPEVIQLTARTNQKYFVCESPSRLREGLGEGLLSGASPTSPPPPPPASGRGVLANAFVCTANIEASDGGAGVVAGNRKVLAARLSDARFFWEQDRKKTLAQHAEGLARITFHEKLGTVADKVERVAKLARWLVEEGIVKTSPERGGGPQAEGEVVEGSSQPDSTPPSAPAGLPPPRSGEVLDLANLAEQAARLCKADLVTEMVGEFPELQGLMGGYYARAEGLPDAVADAIRDHYKPVGQGDDVPTAPVTVAVSLADKLDTLIAFFAAGMLPSGSKDPFALRRSALGILGLLQANELRLSISRIVVQTFDFVRSSYLSTQMMTELAKLRGKDIKGSQEHLGRLMVSIMNAFSPSRAMNDVERDAVAALAEQILDFFADRLKVQQREAGVRHDLIDAVFALGGEDDLVRLLALVHALQAFIGSPDGANLLAGYKRAANILKKEDYQPEPVRPERSRGTGSSEAENGLGTASASLGLSPSTSLGTNGLGGRFSLSYTPEPAEKALIDALGAAGPKAAAAVAAEDFAAAMAALALLRSAVDAFFDQVTVNDADSAKRSARLGLLAQFRDAVHAVADFSRIEG